MQYTPVIPPYPAPAGAASGGGGGASPRRPPVIPSFSPNNLPTTPSWAQPHQYPGNSPYMTGGAFVGGTPGSYFVPPVALPSGQVPHTPVAPVGGGGFSADWTGFPSGGSPYAQQGSHPQTPYAQPGQQTPYAPAAHAPPGTAYTTFQQPLPPGFPPQGAGFPPQGFPPQAGFPTPGQPGQPMWGMQMGMPMGMPMFTPFAMPGGMPPSGAMPPAWAHTPYGQPGGGGLPPQGPPPAAAQHAGHQQPAMRPQDVTEVDKVDKFAEGPHYGPVLEPFIVKKVMARVQINPLIQPPLEVGERDYLKWSMLFTTTQCQRSSDPAHRSWSNGRHAPATWPRVTSLRLISRALPWAIDITASDMASGVTCGDVIEAIQTYMYTKISQAQFDGAPPGKKRELSEAYYHNRSTALGVPGGKLPQTLLRMDWLGQNVVFGGIQVDERLVRELCGAPLPCTFELTVAMRYPMTEAELRDQDAREAAADEHLRRRGRSRATSRNASRGPSRGPSRATSRAANDSESE